MTIDDRVMAGQRPKEGQKLSCSNNTLERMAPRLDIIGVTGSIPAAPTILPYESLDFALRGAPHAKPT